MDLAYGWILVMGERGGVWGAAAPPPQLKSLFLLGLSLRVDLANTTTNL